jgi:membrane associated rhomboid family serine protease
MHSTWRGSYYSDFGAGWGPPLPAVKWLLISNAAVFVLQALLPRSLSNDFARLFELYALAVREGWIWQFVTYMFLHSGPLHLIFNLLILYIFGNEVEGELGTKRFLTLYFMGGIVGAIVWFAFNFGGLASMVGASGGVYAVVIAFATLHPNRPITLLLFFILPVTLLAKYLALITVGISLLFSISSARDGIAHLAHLGGMAAGFLYIRMLRYDYAFPKISLPKFRRRSRAEKMFHVVRSEALQEEDETSPKNKRYMEEKIDPILDKIAKYGIQSLTPEERKLLDEAKDRLI